MSATQQLQILAGACTQSAADTYTEAEIATGIGSGNFALRVKRIEFQIPNLVEVDSNLTITLNRKSTTSNPNINSRYVIARWGQNTNLTTSGYAVIQREKLFSFQDEDNFLIVEDPIYLAVSSTTTSAANTAYVRILYQQVTVTDLARLSIVSSYASG